MIEYVEYQGEMSYTFKTYPFLERFITKDNEYDHKKATNYMNGKSISLFSSKDTNILLNEAKKRGDW